MLSELSRENLRIYSFCGSISRATRSVYSLIEFPELMKYKPKEFYRNASGERTAYWWYPYSCKKRIEVLKRVIEDTEKS